MVNEPWRAGLQPAAPRLKCFFYIIKHHCHGCARAFSPHHSRGTNLYVFPNKYVKISCVISKINVCQTFAPSRLRLTSAYLLRQALRAFLGFRPSGSTKFGRPRNASVSKGARTSDTRGRYTKARLNPLYSIA